MRKTSNLLWGALVALCSCSGGGGASVDKPGGLRSRGGADAARVVKAQVDGRKIDGLWFIDRDTVLEVRSRAGGRLEAAHACGGGSSYRTAKGAADFAIRGLPDANVLEVVPETEPTGAAANIPRLTPFGLALRKLGSHRADFTYVVPIAAANVSGAPADVFRRDWWRKLAKEFDLPPVLPDFGGHLRGFPDDVAAGRAPVSTPGAAFDVLEPRRPSTTHVNLTMPLFTVSRPARRIASDLRCEGEQPAPQVIRFADGGEDIPWGLPLKEAYPRALAAFLGQEEIGEPGETQHDGGKKTACVDAGDQESDCAVEKAKAPNVYYECDITDFTLSGLKTLSRKAILDPQSDLAPGVIVKASSLPTNKLSPVALKRNPMTVHVTGCSTGDVTIPDVPVFDFPGAHAAMTQALASCELSSQSEAYSATDRASLDSFKFHVGVSGNYAGFKGKLDLDVERVSRKKVFRAMYTQVWASARVDFPTEGAMSLFADPDQKVDGQISVTNFPVLIKDVNYGRQLYLIIETDSEKLETLTTLELAYQEQKRCEQKASTCEREKKSCLEAAEQCDPSDPAACRMMKMNCHDEYDECMEEADACTTDAMIKIEASLKTVNEQATESVEAFSSGPNGVVSVTAGAATLEERKNAVAKWFAERPAKFMDLRPVSTEGYWLEPLYRPATYALTVATSRTDCRERENHVGQLQPVRYTLDLEGIDDEVHIWQGPPAGEARIKHRLGTYMDVDLTPVGGFIEPGRETTISLLIGNGGGWSSGGRLVLRRDGEKVWEHDEARLVRHTGWIYWVELRVTHDGVQVLKEYPCVNHLDCML